MATRRTSEAVWKIGLCLLLSIYAWGLTRELTEPWIGMHDWNGAFYSQLARNLRRYPFAIHHGMPVMAVGEEVPPPEERSIYATHPPGLIWLLAAFFSIGGEKEWVARLGPIIASLATVPLFCGMVWRRCGQTTALLAGLIYVVMPMPVYFGRMVDQEPFCLFFMIAAMAGWRRMIDPAGTPSSRSLAGVGCAAALIAGITIDWPGMLFAAILSVYTAVLWRRRQIKLGPFLVVGATSLIGVTAMLAYVVYAGLGGWNILAEVFFSRRSEAASQVSTTPWAYTVENLTSPVLALATLGLLSALFEYFHDQRAKPEGGARWAKTGPSGLGLLSVTGVLWVAVFWRQYQIHNYWLYYLGPIAAWLAARGLVSLCECVKSVGPAVSWAVFVAAILLVAWFGKIGADDYFRRVSCPLEWVQAWRTGHERVPPTQRVAVPGRPIAIEEHGGYRFRNIVPPQMAYYLDRALATPGPRTSTNTTAPAGSR